MPINRNSSDPGGEGDRSEVNLSLPVGEDCANEVKLTIEPPVDNNNEDSSLLELKETISKLLSNHPTLKFSAEKIQKILSNESLLPLWHQDVNKKKQCNAVDTAKRFVHSLEWRDVNYVDPNYLDELQPIFPVYFGSVDNANRPVVYVPLNRWRLEEIPSLVLSGNYQSFITSFFEHVMLLLETKGPLGGGGLQKFSVIINVGGLSIKDILRPKLFRKLSFFSRTMELYYPATLLRCIVINCASRMDKKILQFTLRPYTWKRCQAPSLLHIYMRNSNWTEVLRSTIPSEELLVECGGWKQLPEDVVDSSLVSENSASCDII